MSRPLRIFAAVFATALLVPQAALAEPRFSPASLGAHLGLSAVGLVVAIVLLVEVLGVRRLAMGGVVARRMSFVVLAVICLAASALAEWATNFVGGLTLDQTQLASEILVIAAMGLLGVYFWNVRAGMKSYLTIAEETAEAAPTTPADQDDVA